MRKELKKRFFKRPTILVAQELLGKFLVKKNGSKRVAHMITEVEVYDGPRDLGSHAARGLTPRTKIMFGPAGYWYVYFTYGIYWMLNIVTREKDYPAAILIRGVERISGPGRLTRALDINRKFNGRAATESSGLWIEDRGIKIPNGKIKKGPRIGIDYAGPYWAKRHWRFWLNPSVSARYLHAAKDKAKKR